MSNNTYTRTTITGATQHTRKGTQGAPIKADELKEDCTVVIHMTESDYQRFIKAKGNMTNSAFGRLIVFAGLESYLSQTIG